MDSDQAAMQDAELSRFQNWINKHLISLVLVYHHVDESGNYLSGPLCVACSGFVMAFGETWFLASAGHVIQDLDLLIAHPRVRVVESYIVDSFGSDAKHFNNVPFNYGESDRHSVYRDGFDVGLILLSSNQRRLIEANDVQPIGVENWINQDIDKCTGFVLLGIPAELVMPVAGGTRGLKIGTVIISLQRQRKLPPGADDTEHERFIGYIGAKLELHSLEGVSGGPIIGFADIDGRTYYWVVALQSKCVGKEFVLGCYVKHFGQMILDEMMTILHEQEQH